MFDMTRSKLELVIYKPKGINLKDNVLLLNLLSLQMDYKKVELEIKNQGMMHPINDRLLVMMEMIMSHKKNNMLMLYKKRHSFRKQSLRILLRQKDTSI